MSFDYTTVDAASIQNLVEAAITAGEEAVAVLVAEPGARSFANSLLPLQEVAATITDAYGRGPFLGNVHPDAGVREAARTGEERLTKWTVDLAFREDLYRAVQEYAQTEEAAALTGERRRLLEFTLRDFRKAGHELDPAARAEVHRLSRRLVEIGVEFAKNIAEYQDALEVSGDDLAGLPDDYLARLQPGQSAGSYRVTMDYPDVLPFLENARRRHLRERLRAKFESRAVEANRPLLQEAVQLRRTIAAIFGVPSWAHHQMDEKMAKAPERVADFYEELLPPLTAAARREIAVMAELLADDESDGTLQTWDVRYYDTQLRKRDYGVDPIAVAAYFPLERVVEGMLALTAEVFGLEYRILPDPGAWHGDVTLYEVRDAADGSTLGHFFADLFPREGKYSHAAAFPLVVGRREPDGSYRRPVSAIIANFTKPTADRPSLLQHSEVVTLFHEFGHILHMSLTQAEFVRFSGAETEWDFVEAPSQIMENWCWTAEVLRRFGRHHQSGEPIPDGMVERLVAARNLNISLETLRQISYGLFDLALHGADDGEDIDAALRRTQAVTLLPFHEGTFFPASFGHLLGGYDAGYYGYLWAQVYGDDMFSCFVERGVTDPEVGLAYRRQVLEPNGSRDAEESLRSFLGREPSSEAFLRKLGITR